MTLPLNAPGSPLFRDRLETKASAWIRAWDGDERSDAILIGAPHSRTSISPSAASTTPQAFRELLGAVTTFDIEHDVDLAERLVVRDAGDARVHVTDNAAARTGIHDAVSAVVTQARDAIAVVIGGDHAITAPSFEAVRAARGGALGLVQLDAHMDLRNLDDGGPSNGTPVRQLLTAGVLDGRHTIQLGLHAFANARAYRDLAREAGITQLTAMRVVQTPGAELARLAGDVAGRAGGGIYVTLDMDVVAQAFAPGVPALVPGGMTPWQLLDVMHHLGRDERVCALDVVEIDPMQDPRRATVRLAVHAVLTFLSGVASRPGRA